jgi:hypothetical protein
MMVEKKLLTHLRQSKNSEDVQEDLDNNTFPNFPTVQRSEGFQNIPYPTWGVLLTDNELKTNKTTSSTNKLKFAVFSRVLYDILATMVKYGLNPVWAKNPSKQGNAKLDLYLQ